MLQFILMFTAVLFLSAIFINGFYNITRPGMIFGWWDEFLKGVPKILSMPLGGCITCMSSIFGTLCFIFWDKIGHIFILFSTLGKVGLWIFFCVCLAWVNEIIFNINHKLKQQK